VSFTGLPCLVLFYLYLTRVTLNGVGSGSRIPICGPADFYSIDTFTVPLFSENLQTIVSEPRLSSIKRAGFQEREYFDPFKN
jgi:hypothetical protein